MVLDLMRFILVFTQMLTNLDLGSSQDQRLASQFCFLNARAFGEQQLRR